MIFYITTEYYKYFQHRLTYNMDPLVQSLNSKYHKPLHPTQTTLIGQEACYYDLSEYEYICLLQKMSRWQISKMTILICSNNNKSFELNCCL